MTDKKLELQVPTQGWRQLLTNRAEILATYDRAREQARSHRIETSHGPALEAAVRHWLTGFLPKRYGVTPGYIVSPGLSSRDRLPHFDVIIYDQLDSPVLWIEGTPDSSEQGKSMAIPVEYVRAVVEVKAAFSASTAQQAVAHLGDLQPLLSGVDDDDARYKLHLDGKFCCGVVFGELRESDSRTSAGLDAILAGTAIRGFFGAAILRAEGHTLPHTGLIRAMHSESDALPSLDPKTTPLSEYAFSSESQSTDEFHVRTFLAWSEHYFSQFGFDLIAMMQGTRDSHRSSFYGVGGSFLEMILDTQGIQLMGDRGKAV